MKTAQQTGKIIIVIALSVSAMGLNSLHAEEAPPCDKGFCLFPKAASAEKEAIKLETKKAALKNLVSRQAADCALMGEVGSSTTLSAKLAGELFSLRKQIVIKAQETGLLLQLPSIVLEFMGSCSLKKDWNQLCGDHGGLLRKSGIPYRKGFLALSSQES
jgi:hypothetical protein